MQLLRLCVFERERERLNLTVFNGRSARAQTFLKGEEISKITRQVGCGLCAAAAVLNMWSAVPSLAASSVVGIR